MVLAAGLGNRLRPLTDLCAKPLVPVGDRPALEHVLDRLRGAGIQRLVVNAHHRAEDVRAFARRQQGDVHVSDEPSLLGTAGGVARAADLLGGGNVVVWNGDILAEIDVRALVHAHAAGAAAGAVAATLVVQPRAPGQGSVGLDRDGRVVRLRGRRIAEEASGGEFLGIHVLGSALRAQLPDRGCLVGDGYIPALEGGVLLRAYVHDAPFFDIGTIRRYLEANLAWLSARGVAQWVAPGAHVAAGVALDRAIVGQGASARGAGALERCVVWAGADAVAPLADAVVAPGLVVSA